MTETKTLAAAQSYHAAGLSMIPIRVDGSKAPDILQWKGFQQTRPTEGQLKHWFGNGTPHGIGLVHGAVSGNSEVMDFDQPGLYEQFAHVATEQGYGDLLESLPLVETPSGGRHLVYRCQEPVSGNTKLAETPTRKTRIETRGEGGYTLAPGSPPSCHPDGRPYLFLRGRPSTIPTITAEERSVLLDLARLFNEHVDTAKIVDAPRTERTNKTDRLRPGDDYNSRGDYEAVLEAQGWRRMGHAGDKGLWQRPGKTGRGLSATSNYGGAGLFYVFSSNAAPFEPQKAYSPFAVYALLRHGGDYTEAARTLAQERYGDPLPPPPPAKKSGEFKRTPLAVQSSPGPIPVHTPGSPWDAPLPFSTQALPPFPVEALPPVLAAYVSEIAASSQVPPDMAGMLALAVVAAAAGRRAVVKIGRTHFEPLNLFIAVVMEPGSRKSAIMDMAAPLRDYEAVLVRREGPTIAAAKETRAVEEKRVSFLRDQASKENDAQKRGKALTDLQDMAANLTEVPAVPRLLADNITTETVATLMSENGGALALLSPEGGLFGILAGRYSGKGDPDLDVFLKGHAGDEIRVDRKSRPPDFVRRPALTVGLLVQPDVIASLADSPSFRGRGLLGRFLYSLPESLAGTRKYQDRPVDGVVKAQYDNAIEQILELPDTGTEDDPTARHSLSLTGDALALWAAFADDVEARQAEGRDLAGIRDFASKLAGQVARIAGGFHLLEHAGLSQAGGDWQQHISPESVAAAWAIGQYLIPHALAAFGQMGADPRLALARRIVRWIERTLKPDAVTGEAQFTLRDCQRGHSGGNQHLTADEVQAALLLLVEREFIRHGTAQQETGGRPGSPAYVVNPAVFTKTGTGN